MILHAVADYLASALPGVDVEAGWPDWEKRAGDLRTSFVSVIPRTDPRETLHPPREVSFREDPDNPQNCLVLYCVGNVGLEIDLDLWGHYQASLEDLDAAVGEVWHNRIPFATGLYLTLPDYHNVTVTFYAPETVVSFNRELPPTGLHRRILRMATDCDILLEKSIPRLNVLQIDTSVS